MSTNGGARRAEGGWNRRDAKNAEGDGKFEGRKPKGEEPRMDTDGHGSMGIKKTKFYGFTRIARKTGKRV
jgi:hypothetical protein